MLRMGWLLLAVIAALAPAGCRTERQEAAAPTGTPPPTPASSSAPAASALKGRVTVTPPAPQSMKEATIELSLTGASGKPAAGRKVSFDLTMPAMAMPPNKPAAKEIRSGVYQAKAVFTMAGEWLVTPKISGETNTDALALRLNAK